MTTNFYLNIAIVEAWKNQGLTYPNPSVGALVQNRFGAIISIGTTSVSVGHPHAEVNAIKEAYLYITKDKSILQYELSQDIHNFLLKNHKDIFYGFTITVTLEPCNHTGATPPCSYLISQLGFKKVVVGVNDNNIKASGGIDYLEKNGLEIELLDTHEAQDLIFPFIKWNNDRFIFFKFASNINGSYTGQISSLKTQKYMHELRSKIDLLVIGGNTVRLDRPTLDSRFSITKKVPDILIYSKSKEFDKSIPLFNVKNRKVFISDNLDLITKYKFIMIEGATGMMEASKNICDAYLFLGSFHLKSGVNINVDLNLNKLHYGDNGSDHIHWYKAISKKYK